MLSWRDNWLVKQPFQSCMETPDWVQSQNILEYFCVPSDAQRETWTCFPLWRLSLQAAEFYLEQATVRNQLRTVTNSFCRHRFDE